MTTAIVAVLSQFKLFTVKDVVQYWPLLLTLTPLSILILWGVCLELRWGGGSSGFEARDVCVCIL